jgi:hypothetical protein
MSDSIEEQIAKILESASTVEDHLAPHRAQIAKLESELAEAKTNPQRRAIRRKLNMTIGYVKQVAGANKRKRPSARQIRRQKAGEKKLDWCVRKARKNRS